MATFYVGQLDYIDKLNLLAEYVGNGSGPLSGTIIYKGTWSASSGAYPASAATGHYYKVDSAGSVSGVTYSVNDAIIYNGSGWDKIDNSAGSGSLANSITFNNAGAGAASGTTFNGNSAVTISYNTVGAAANNKTINIGTSSFSLDRASGSQTLNGVNIDGNAATVSNGVYTTGSYANPSWITSLAYSKLTGAPSLATVATTGSYTDLSNTPAAYTLPIASATVLGGIKIGSGLSIDGNGVVTAAGTYTLPTASATVLGGIKIGSGLSIDGNGVVTAAGTYTLPIASATVLGGIKIGSGLSIDGNGVVTAAGTYTLPTASATVLGGIKIGSGLSIDGAGVVSATGTSGVTTFSAGSTGLTPNTSTSGAITLAGTLNIANGGTGATTAANALTNLGAQPLDADLTAIAGLAGTSGFLKKTAADSWSLDTNTYITSSGSVSGTAGGLSISDSRTISPSTHSLLRLTFGFTSWANNNTTPYADFLHFRSWSDSSGGNDNLLTFRKDAIGLRLWQQTWGSATAYSSYKDIAWTDGTNATGTWAISITGNAGTVTNGIYTTSSFNLGTTSIALNRASGSQSLTGVSIDGNAGTVTNGIYTTSSFNLGTTSIALNRASGSQTLSGISIDGNAGTVTNGIYTTSSFNLGTTSIALNRASTSQSLTGINIDGNAGTTTKWATSRTVTFTGDVTGSFSIDGSADVSNVTLTSSVSATGQAFSAF